MTRLSGSCYGTGFGDAGNKKVLSVFAGLTVLSRLLMASLDLSYHRGIHCRQHHFLYYHREMHRRQNPVVIVRCSRGSGFLRVGLKGSGSLRIQALGLMDFYRGCIFEYSIIPTTAMLTSSYCRK